MTVSRRRLAALQLAGLHRADRRWVLKRLSRPVAVELERLVRKLEAIGPIDRTMLESILDARGGMDLPLEAPPPDELIARLDRLDSHWAALALKACAADHLELYEVHCGKERAAQVRGHFERLPSKLPAALAAAATRQLRAGDFRRKAAEKEVA